MPNWLIIVAVLAALALGLLGNRWWRGLSGSDESQGFDIGDVVGPVTTLAVVLLAFLVVEAISSPV